MLVHSTRSNDLVDIMFAIEKGLADDGGLFVFDEIIKYDLESLKNLSYNELTRKILSPYLGNDNKIYDNYPSFEIKVKNINNEYSYLELFHGPTSAFKDVALTFLPRLLKSGHILVATSGDTGSATLSGFSVNKNIDVTVLYPNNLVSELQEKQMLYYSTGNNKAFAYKGNFDDCQKTVKDMFLKNKNLSSANSINIGRLLPQIIYYFYGYFRLVENGIIKLNDKINVSVPTGNFGNILAGYIAKRMGLPIDKLICATNKNRVLYDFINTGVYNRNRDFYKTYSPSMDILVSSNMERFLYYFYNDTNKIKELYKEFNETGIIKIKEYKELFKDFVSFYTDDDASIKLIKKEYDENNYLIDPHTSNALNASLNYKSNYHTLILSTASPYKFENAINKAGIELDINDCPTNLKAALNTQNKKQVIDKEMLEVYINENKN